jgi:hypothetical protein
MGIKSDIVETTIDLLGIHRSVVRRATGRVDG